MDKVKLKAPQGVTSASFGGEEFQVNKAGIVTVPPEAVAALADHGFKPVAGAEPEGGEGA